MAALRDIQPAHHGWRTGMPPSTVLRIARPVSDLARSVAMHKRGLALHVIGSFEDHEGFDGAMLGLAGAGYHFEFTFCRAHPVAPAPTAEDLVVLYLPDAAAWRSACADMVAAGFAQVASFNPYWDARGRTFADHDAYRVVLQNAAWPARESRVPHAPTRVCFLLHVPSRKSKSFAPSRTAPGMEGPAAANGALVVAAASTFESPAGNTSPIPTQTATQLKATPTRRVGLRSTVPRNGVC
jgi:hypothetical protein